MGDNGPRIPCDPFAVLQPSVPKPAINPHRVSPASSPARDRGAHGGGAAITPARRARHLLALVRSRLRARDLERAAARHTAGLVDRLPLVVHASRLCDDSCLYVSPQLETWLGLDRRPGGARPWVAHVHDGDRARLEREWAAWRAAGETPFRARYRLLAGDGTTLSVEEVTSLVRNASGQAVGLEGYLLDVTEHEVLLGALEQAQRLEPLGRLASGVAHDFNNLLTVIRGYGERLAATVEDADARDDALQIVDAGERGATLVRQLLAFARPRPSEVRLFDLAAVVDDVAPMLQRLIGDNIALEVASHARPLPIRADRGQIEQVIVNLVVNARDSMPNGGRVEVETTWSPRHPDRADDEAHAVLSVTDTGVGMDPQTMARIFDPYFTTKERDCGNGIGLATVEAIVIRAGGSIGVSSVPGEGARFTVYLPIAEGAPVPLSATPNAAPEIAGHGRTVLLVEDDAALRELEQLVLEDAGFSVLAAADGREALEHAARKTTELDVLVTDVVLPDVSGTQLAASVRALGRNMPVLFVSGYDREHLARRGMLGAGARVITKPFRRETFLGELADALDRRDR
jgi:two-component system, cell cycle sensor histidine kinase and response regulator CckA